jgi:hypothetical protein
VVDVVGWDVLGGRTVIVGQAVEGGRDERGEGRGKSAGYGHGYGYVMGRRVWSAGSETPLLGVRVECLKDEKSALSVAGGMSEVSDDTSIRRGILSSTSLRTMDMDIEWETHRC